VAILDDTIGELLTEAQHTTVQETLELEAQKRNQAITEQKEAIKQKIAQTASATEQLMLNLEIVTALKQSELNLVRLESETEVERKKLEARLSEQESLNKIDAAELSREKAQYDLKLGVTQQQLNQRLEEIKAEVEAVVNKAGAVSPRLIAALQSFADKALAERMAESMSPLAILGGKSVADVLGQLLKGTVVERALARFEEDE